MIREIVDNILPYLTALNFSDTVAGCVVTINRNVPDKDNKIQKKSFPAYYNDDKTLCNNYTTYVDLVPNTSKKSIIYFEENGTRFLGQNAGLYELNADIKLICWANLNLINKAYTDATKLKLNIIKTLEQFPQNIPNKYSFIRISFSGEDAKTNAIFGKYTYNEQEKQYMIYPFDYFALNFNVLFYASKFCIDDVTLDPSIC